MSSDDRRTRARRRAWGRGPTILRFEPLEGRQLLTATNPLAVIASAAGMDTSTLAATGTDSHGTTATPATTTTTTGSASTPAAATTSTTTTAAAATVGTTDASLAADSAAPVAAKPVAAKPVVGKPAPAGDASNLVALSFTTGHNLDWGDAFHASGAVKNVGPTATTAPRDLKIYASTTPSLGSDAVFVGTLTIPSGVPAGGVTSFDADLAAPPVPLATLGNAPSYYLVPKLSGAASGLAATTQASSAPLDSVVTVTPKVPPKLVGAGISVNPGGIAWGDTLSVTAIVKNISQGAAPPTNARIILTPVGKTPGAGSDYQIGQVPIPPIGGFQTVTATQKITLPSFAPTLLANSSRYTVTMVQDADAAANPLISSTISTSANDTTSLTIAVPAGSTSSSSSSSASTPSTPVPTKPLAADLSITSVQEPSPTMFRGATFPVGATIRNSGPGDAGPFKVRFLLVTDESANAPALVLGDATLPGLAAGTEQDVLQTVTLPYRTPSEFAATNPTGRIVAQVDPDRSIDQTNTSNDSLAAPPVALRVLTADGQTTVPTLPGSTATTTTTKGATATTPATTADGTSGFTSTTVAAATTPATARTTTSTTTPSTPATATPTPAASTPKATAAATHASQVAAKHAATVAKAHVQLVARQKAMKAKIAARAHALKVYHPGAAKGR